MVQVLQHRPLLVLDDETLEAKAALGVLVELIHVAQIAKDGAEINGTAEHTSHSVPARPHWADERLALELHLLCKLRACVGAAKNFARKLGDLMHSHCHPTLRR